MAAESSHRAGKVLLTGASGFIGGHILAKLLDHGLSVRAVVRTEKKRDMLKECYPGVRRERLDFALVKDITISGSFDNALQSDDPITSVIHTASPFLYEDVHDNLDLLDPAVKGTQRILEGALSVSSVGRVVLTGSIGAVLNYTSLVHNNGGRKVYSGDDWNPITWEEAMETTDKATAYRASKKFAEKAAWDFMEAKRPKFDLVTLLPVMVYGPMMQQIRTARELNESNLRIWKLFLDSASEEPMPPNGVHLFVDPRDVADAHLQAILRPEASGQRLILCQGPITSQQIADILRRVLPHFTGRIPVGTPGANTLAESDYLADGKTAAHLLGLQYRDMDIALVDLAMQLRFVKKANSQS